MTPLLRDRNPRKSETHSEGPLPEGATRIAQDAVAAATESWESNEKTDLAP